MGTPSFDLGSNERATLMPAFIIPSFGKGELAPALHGRVDTAAYQVSLATARNLIIHPYGGASNRPGTLYIGPVGDHTLASRLFRFQFRTTDQYVLVFQNLTMRVIRNDAFVTETAVNISSITKASPVEITTSGAHGLVAGEDFFVEGIVGMTELNGRFFTAGTVPTTTTVELTHQVTGGVIDGLGFTAYTSGGTTAEIFELATPYLTADLPNLKIVQSGDILTITHRTYAPRDLARTDHNAWTLTVNTYAPEQADPTGVAVAQQGASGAVTQRYKVTAIRNEEDGFEESLPGLDSGSVTLSSATLANPVRCVVGTDVYVTGDEIEISAMDEMTALNGRRFFVTRIDATHIDLDDEDGTDTAVYPTAETTGGVANATFVELTDAVTQALTTSANFNQVTWTAASGAGRYGIYRRESGRYGLVAEVDAPIVSFDDVTESIEVGNTAGIHAVDLTIGPPRARNPFLASGTFPGASGYYQQRQQYGGSTDNPDTTYHSQTGNRLNMSVSTPTQADDAITTKFDSVDFNEIRHFVPLTDLIVLTSSGPWRISAGDNSGFSADTLLQQPQSQWGASHQQPIVIGDTILFTEDGGVRVRGIGFSLEADKYIGPDLSQFADHLLGEDGPSTPTISDWSYASIPESRLYIPISDGQLLTLTYDKTQAVVAWTHWDTDGSYEQTTALQRSISGVEDGIYFQTQRTIDFTSGVSSTVRYIERQATRKFADVRDAFFVDCGLTLDTALAITGSSAAEPVVITATAHGFSNNDDVDIEGIVWDPTFDSSSNSIQPDQLNDRQFTIFNQATNTFELAESQSKPLAGATIANPVVVTSSGHNFDDDEVVYISNVVGMTEINNLSFTVANGTDNTFELKDIDGSGYTAWSGGGDIKRVVDGTDFRAYVSGGNARQVVTSLTGLNHLEGESVEILADGSPVPEVLVADATASNPTTVVVDGALTLKTGASRVHVGMKYVADWETLNIEETGVGTIQGTKQTVASVTVRFYKSRLPLVGPNRFNMNRMEQREDEAMGLATTLLSGDKRHTVKPEWNSNGRLFFRQDRPLPTTILAIIPDIITEDSDDE